MPSIIIKLQVSNRLCLVQQESVQHNPSPCLVLMIMMCMGVDFFGYIFFRIYELLKSVIFFFYQFGMFTAIISSSNFSTVHFILSFWDSDNTKTHNIVLWTLETLQIFQSFSLCFSDCMLSVNLSLSSLTSLCLCHSIIEFIQQVLVY